MTPRTTVLAICLLAALAAAVFRDNPLTRAAQGHAQSVAVAAGATYVTLRTLNALLSTAQEFEVGLSFIASGSAQPLKWLEPIDDTVERIASLVFGIMVATGILAVALGPVSAIGMALLAVALALRLFLQGREDGLDRKLGWYGAFLGLALPVALIISAPLASVLTGDTYRENIAVIDDITVKFGKTEVLEQDEPGFAEYRELAGNIAARADDLIGALLMVLGVHVFGLLILPLLLIGGMFVIARHFARARPTKLST
ncbi:hypothetical protein [Sulfitobacter aestuariivivens]|uniref:Uncharacterized protein n=1 Tax=Sulfitobacter aestuariivivens TaxID=2766981 RepID=A0A927HF56_9RHOB|nr:hypothetical protein [Sulfitobacter aestuariivivens]MBD3664073.1 hypothetical protein [Sulfitobacter aestuariivivens]